MIVEKVINRIKRRIGYMIMLGRLCIMVMWCFGVMCENLFFFGNF